MLCGTYHTGSIVSGLETIYIYIYIYTEILFGVILFLNAKNFVLLSCTISVLFVAVIPLF